MALIPAYPAALQVITPVCEYGGFDAATGTITPFAKFEPFGIYEVLDVIAASAEAGALDSDKWVSQIFANNDVFNNRRMSGRGAR